MDDVELDQQLAGIFFIESAEMLEEASFTLLKAEAAGNPSEAIHKVFRAIHSIKGGAQSLGFEQLAEVAHCMEAFMVPFQQGEKTADGQTVSLMLESMDVIEGQLQGYQSGQIPSKSTEFLAKLAEATLQLQGNPAVISKKNEIVKQQEIIKKTSRLLYLSFIVDQAAIMPGMTAFLLLERLRLSGRLLYSQPDIDGSSMAPAGAVFTQLAIVETDLSNEAVQQEAYRIGEIQDIKISELGSPSRTTADQPAKKELEHFNCLVTQLWQELCNRNSHQDVIIDLATQIAAWGATSRGTAGWFPGGLPAWQRLTSLLINTLPLKEIALQTLQVLWENVYHALRNQTYFYSFAASKMLSGNGLQEIAELEAKGVDVQSITIDLSLWKVLEFTHLNTLVQLRKRIAEKGWDLWLISEGEYTRRHVNVLEISEGIVEHLDLYPSSYSGIITQEKCNV